MADEGEAPVEFYVDAYEFIGSPYTVHLTFGVAVPGERPEDAYVNKLVVLRMSPEHAKVMSILFKRAVREYEERTGTEIAVAPAMLEAHKINLALDW
jgi:hypothetical protein